VTVWEWLAAMLRRWPILLAGVVGTVGAVVLVHGRLIAYQSCGSVLVTAPKTFAYPNIYNNPRGSLVAATGLIVQELSSDQVQQKLTSQGLTASYQVVVHNTGTTETPAYSEPLMDVCASSYDPGMAQRTTDALIKEFGAILQERQASAHVKSKSRLTDAVVVAPSPAPLTGRPSQAYLGVGISGLIITAALALWTDLFRRRQRRRTLPARSRIHA
jgi:hypothetical protein